MKLTALQGELRSNDPVSEICVRGRRERGLKASLISIEYVSYDRMYDLGQLPVGILELEEPDENNVVTATKTYKP